MGKLSVRDLDTRIRESLPTIKLLRAKGAKVILLAHFGGPNDFYFNGRRRISRASGGEGIARGRGPYGLVIGI